MSGTQPTPAAPSSPTLWGAPIVSVLAYATFLAAIVVAFVVKNDALLITLCGMAGANATTAVSFWLGSSKGSQDKSAQLATQSSMLANAPPPPPPGGSQTVTTTAPITVPSGPHQP